MSLATELLLYQAKLPVNSHISLKETPRCREYKRLLSIVPYSGVLLYLLVKNFKFLNYKINL